MKGNISASLSLLCVALGGCSGGERLQRRDNMKIGGSAAVVCATLLLGGCFPDAPSCSETSVTNLVKSIAKQ